MAETQTLAFASHNEFPYAGGTKKGFKFLTADGTEYVAFDPDLYAAFVKAGDGAQPRSYVIKPGENGKSPMIVAIPGVYEKQGGRGGGGGGWKGKSPEEIRSIQRQTALIQAVALRSAEIASGASRSGTQPVVEYANEFINWLEQGQSKPTAGAQSSSQDRLISESPAAATSGGSVAEGEAVTGSSDTGGEGASASSPPDCPPHSFTAGPNPKFQVCEKCGLAEKAA